MIQWLKKNIGITGAGSALALLLAGPSVSPPNMLVVGRVIGAKRVSVYLALVVTFSTMLGVAFQMLVG